jgi:exonuclease I
MCSMSLHYTVLYKSTNHQQMHKASFIINCNTLLHVSTLLGHLQGELSVIVTLRLHLSVTITGRTFCYRYTKVGD